MLQKQAVNINFSEGLDTKSDPWQVPAGKFLSLENSVFQKGGLLQKRNGFGALTALPDASSNYLTTFNGNLTAIGTSFSAYSQGSSTWINKGSFRNVNVDTLPIIRSNTNQSQCDAVVAPNGVMCVVYTDNLPSNGSTVQSYKYSILDSVTGQNIINPTIIPSPSGAIVAPPKVYLLNNYFIIVVVNKISSTYHLQYIAINSTTPSVVNTNVDISTQFSSDFLTAYEGYVVGNKLFIAWNASDGGGAIRIASLTSTLVLSSSIAFTGYQATVISVCADITTTTPVIYVTSYDNSSTQTGSVFAISPTLGTVLAPTTAISVSPVLNLASAAQNGSVTIFYEVNTSYFYDSSIQFDYIQSVNVTQAGTVGSPTSPIRSVGLASKAFILNGVIYFLAAYSSTNQPTYFLIDYLSNVSAKIAYQNGGGYLVNGLPNISINGSTVSIAYLFKDLIQAVSKAQGAIANGAAIYSQTGINFASFDIGGPAIYTSEIGANLNLSGGFLWAYDGVLASEQNFFLYPDYVEAFAADNLTATGTVTDTSNIITAVVFPTNLTFTVGMKITGTGIPANTTITALSSNTITISHNATASNTSVTLTVTGAVGLQQYYYQAIYTWTDNQGNIFRSAPSIPFTVTPSGSNTLVKVFVPTLRLTYKVANPIKIEIYRWSAAQQNYYEITQIANPVFNSTQADFIEFTDIYSDAQILGNSLIYTTGGVLENTGIPAISAMTLFDDRLFFIYAEDKNLLGYTKQVIENTPVETSDLLSMYVAPTISAQGSTGPMKSIFPMDDKLIIFKTDAEAIYYINGTGPDNTGANSQYSQPIFITSNVGSNNQASLVLTPSGIMFQSDKGIWLLGRDLSTTYIGAPVEAFTQNALVVSAVAVPGTNQVRFVLDSGVTLMYDYYYAQWGTFVGIPAISSTLYNDLHTIINSKGAVLQETPGLYLDNGNPVLLGFLTSWIALAGLQGYQRAYFFYLLAEYLSPHKLNVQIAYNYNPSFTQSTLISPTNFAPTYGSVTPYGQNNYGGADNVENWRIFLAEQRCTSFQISINEVYDPSFGVTSGAGFTMSGINLVVGVKKGFRSISSANSAGGGTNRG